MANLVDMRRRTKEKIDDAETALTGEDDYDYGLKIRLDNESIGKLGIPLPEVGKEVNIMAKATVVEANQRSVDGAADRGACLQITEMSMTKPAGDVDADKLYPTMSDKSSVRTEE